MIFDIARQDTDDPDKIDKKTTELRAKYRVDRVLFKGFDFFNPPSEDENYTDNKLSPNNDIQMFFMLSFHHARRLKKKLYEMEYVTSQAPIDFLPDSNKKLIKDSEEVLAMFTNLDSTLKPLRIYRDFGAVLTTNTQLSEPEFLETIKDIAKGLELTNEEKDVIRAEIDKSVRDNL